MMQLVVSKGAYEAIKLRPPKQSYFDFDRNKYSLEVLTDMIRAEVDNTVGVQLLSPSPKATRGTGFEFRDENEMAQNNNNNNNNGTPPENVNGGIVKDGGMMSPSVHRHTQNQSILILLVLSMLRLPVRYNINRRKRINHHHHLE